MNEEHLDNYMSSCGSIEGNIFSPHDYYHFVLYSTYREVKIVLELVSTLNLARILDIALLEIGL